MDNRKKNILYSLILVASVFLVWMYRKNQVPSLMKIEGQTMGTTYHISYFDHQKRDFKSRVDSLLQLVNQSINTYDTSSEVSLFNNNPKGIAFKLPYLRPPLSVAAEVFTASRGAFDPTVMPLVNAWGFGPNKKLITDSTRIDSIRAFVGFEKIKVTRDSIVKNISQVQLDFGGIGQGYGADVIADFLKANGIENMLVELGGEGMAYGKNLTTGQPWKIGILDPNSTYENQFFKAYVTLTDKSFTTSGNYFNYHEIEGVKYSHTINPATGYPARQAILSASVFSRDCTRADAWGTAFMVMGHEKAIEILKANPQLDALLIYTDKKGEMQTYITAGIKNFITLEQPALKQ